MKIIALFLAAALSLSSCAQLQPVVDWAKTPGGQEVINATLMDALKIVGVLLLAGSPPKHDLRAEAISRLRAKHPELTQREASVYVDEAIAIQNGK